MEDNKDSQQEAQDEWIRLVHEGTCCAADDTQEIEKQAFIDKHVRGESKKTRECQ